MSALTPEQLDKLADKANEGLTVLVEAFYEATEEGGHFRRGPSGTSGNCSQCGSRWPCHPVDRALRITHAINKALKAFGVDLEVFHEGRSHQPVTVARELDDLRAKYGDEALREAVGATTAGDS